MNFQSKWKEKGRGKYSILFYWNRLVNCSIDYQEKYKYITEKLSVLRTEMDDLKKEDGQTHLDVIHGDNVRRGSTKRKMLDQVSRLLIL